MGSPIAFWMCAAYALVLAAACFVLLLHRVTRNAVRQSILSRQHNP
jgi:MATE family multidrug resistance protein